MLQFTTVLFNIVSYINITVNVSIFLVFRTPVSHAYIIYDYKNLVCYILDNKGNKDPKSNLFIILEYFFTEYQLGYYSILVVGSFEVLIRCWPLHECTGVKKVGGDATCLAPGPYQVALNTLATAVRCMAAHVHLEFI